MSNILTDVLIDSAIDKLPTQRGLTGNIHEAYQHYFPNDKKVERMPNLEESKKEIVQDLNRYREFSLALKHWTHWCQYVDNPIEAIPPHLRNDSQITEYFDLSNPFLINLYQIVTKSNGFSHDIKKNIELDVERARIFVEKIAPEITKLQEKGEKDAREKLKELLDPSNMEEKELEEKIEKIIADLKEQLEEQAKEQEQRTSIEQREEQLSEEEAKELAEKEAEEQKKQEMEEKTKEEQEKLAKEAEKKAQEKKRGQQENSILNEVDFDEYEEHMRLVSENSENDLINGLVQIIVSGCQPIIDKNSKSGYLPDKKRALKAAYNGNLRPRIRERVVGIPDYLKLDLLMAADCSGSMDGDPKNILTAINGSFQKIVGEVNRRVLIELKRIGFRNQNKFIKNPPLRYGTIGFHSKIFKISDRSVYQSQYTEHERQADWQKLQSESGNDTLDFDGILAGLGLSIANLTKRETQNRWQLMMVVSDAAGQTEKINELAPCFHNNSNRINVLKHGRILSGIISNNREQVAELISKVGINLKPSQMDNLALIALGVGGCSQHIENIYNLGLDNIPAPELNAVGFGVPDISTLYLKIKQILQKRLINRNPNK